MRKFLPLLACLLLSASLWAQIPVNDDCAGIIDLGEAPVCPSPGIYTNVNATESVIADGAFNIPSCFVSGNAENDVWFQFSVPADGSVVDFDLSITGAGDNPILNPQVAVYRGELCDFGELDELLCASAGLGEDFVELELLGLTPGLDYFLRINDFSASATPNWGEFEICVDTLVAECNLSAECNSSSACSGILYDSGGPDGDYSSGENLTFTICPTDFHQCIFIDVEEYAFENGFDNLNFYAGPDINSPQIFNLTGSGSNFEVQAASDCVTIQMTSDGSVTNTGFMLSWQCSADTCTIPPIISCDETVDIPSIPFNSDDLSTCFAGNTLNNTTCGGGWINGEDYIFTYDSPGDECVMIDITNSSVGTGVAVTLGCPNTGDCIASDGGDFFDADPTINAAFLEEAGTYYIVVANANACTGFDIEMQQVECPTILPPSSDCEDALNVNGCANAPSTITVSQEPSFNTDFELGCWGGTGAGLFTWFIFEAQEDGNFGFLAEDNTNQGFSDIDINVWGPYTDEELVCQGTLDDAPIRSTWSGLPGVTGLTDTHPVTGVDITDICEGAGGDKFVSTIPVTTGEWYVILVLDYGGTIENGEINMDFTSTSDGVLGASDNAFYITPDTVVCPGETAQLVAEGGALIQWIDDPALSCTNCPNPVATIEETTTFTAIIVGACATDTLDVEVGFLSVDAGPDATVCLNEEFQIVAGASLAGITWEWTGDTQFLSCTDCADPIVLADAPGIYDFTATVTGPSCSYSDDFQLEVLNEAAPEFSVVEDASICVGDALNIGSPSSPGVTYIWTSDIGGFSSDISDPMVAPTETTTYYIEAFNNSSGCPYSSFDSVQVTVFEDATLNLAPDGVICQGEMFVLGNTDAQDGVTYEWAASPDIADPTELNPMVQPATTTTYTLTATSGACSVSESVTVEVNALDIEIASPMPDTVRICLGESLTISANVEGGPTITWTPNDGTLNSTTDAVVVATPTDNTLYIATVTLPGCLKYDSIYIQVDSLPWDMSIEPQDTTICAGQQVVLEAPAYDVDDFENILHVWTPTEGALSPDSLYNMVAQPNETTTFTRVSTNGECEVEYSATINVFDPESVDLIAGPDTSICAGQQVVLTATGAEGQEGEYMWSNGDTGATTTVSPSSTTEYSVSFGLIGSECPGGGSASATVTVLGGVELSGLSADPSELNEGDALNLNATATPADGNTYEWSSNSGIIGNTLEVSTTAPTIDGEVATVTYTIYAVDADGCDDEASIDVTVNRVEVKVPSAFSPNNDDLNDTFKPELAPNHTMESMQVYNRWGQLVYEGVNLDGWDGMYNNKPAPTDVYVYIITIRRPDGTLLEPFRGDVTLLR